MTSPMSLIFTGAPLRYAAMMWRKALASNNWSLVSSVNSWCLPSRLPFGRSVVALTSAVRTSSRLMPRSANAIGLTCTCVAGICSPAMLRLRHAIHPRQRFGQHVVGVLVKVLDRHGVGADGVDQDRPVRRIGLLERRRRGQGLRQQPARRVDRGLHVPRRAVDIARQVELQRDRCRPQSAGGRHLLQTRNGGELLLQRRGDRRGHRLPGWRRATVAVTTMVGKSTFGSAATGSSVNVAMPNTRMPAISSAVAIGRRMKISEMLIAGSAGLVAGGWP